MKVWKTQESQCARCTSEFMKTPSLKELLEAGVHFGHETKRWNPKMASYIFTAKEKIHILDLEKTDEALKKATEFVKKVGEKNGKIIFLTTKKQATDIVKNEAERVGAMYLTVRWLGGLFTNFETLTKNIKKLTELEENSKNDIYTKREQLLMSREAEKLNRVIGGIRTLEALPDAIFIVDSRKEMNAVLEAKKVGVPIVAIVDTNADPTLIDYPIPGNDDAIKAITILVKTIADSYEEGRQIGAKTEGGEVEAEKSDEVVEEAAKPKTKVATKKPKAEKSEEKPKKTVRKTSKKEAKK